MLIIFLVFSIFLMRPYADFENQRSNFFFLVSVLELRSEGIISVTRLQKYAFLGRRSIGEKIQIQVSNSGSKTLLSLHYSSPFSKSNSN